MSEKGDLKITYTEAEKQDASKAESKGSDSGSVTRTSTSPKHEDSLFPWLEVEDRKFSLGALSRFPLIGALSLLGSALTVIPSALVLHFFNGKQVVTGHMPKPAAWLSVILSLNSILVHTAVTKGRSVTWWVKAKKKRTTVADLHYIWATENDLLDAITEWKAWNYIVFATVMVATLPINGILLQTAISSKGKIADLWDASTNFSIVDHLPSGSTATIDPDGSIDLYRYDWQQGMPLIIGNFDGFYKQSLETNTTCKGYCEAVVRGIGFSAQCQESLIAVDLPLDQQTGRTFTPYNVSEPNVNYTIFDIGIAWDHTIPNGWNLTTVWKNDSQCSSNIVQSTCQIQLGSINYPVIVSFNGSNDDKYDWSMNTKNLPAAGDVSDPSLAFTSFGPGTTETVNTNSTYGGLATGLATYFNSSITLNRNNIANTTELKVNGFYAEQLDTLIDQQSLDYRCNISLNHFGQDGVYNNPHNNLLDAFRWWLFFTSIYAMEPNTTIWTKEDQPPAQAVTHVLDEVHITIYVVNWAWYYGSLTVTIGIVLLVLPTFYGFWRLAKETTLSPFETARAFHTPMLQDQPADLPTPELLKTVGKKNFRTELTSPPTSPRVPHGNFGKLE